MAQPIDIAVALAREAGEIIRSNFTLSMEHETKGDGSPVTKVDLAINELVIDAITQYFPDHAVLGEEQSTESLDAEYIWVCDPIDGTIPFTHGLPLSCFSLALTHNGKSVAAVVNHPYCDRLFSAVEGEGTRLNGRAVVVSQATTLAKTGVGAESQSYLRYGMDGMSAELQRRGAYPFWYGSIVMSGIQVACGQYGGAIFVHDTPWDGAAIKLLVQEAGGRVTDLWGQEQRYDRPLKGYVASNGFLHDELLAVVRTCGASAGITGF